MQYTVVWCTVIMRAVVFLHAVQTPLCGDIEALIAHGRDVFIS